MRDRRATVLGGVIAMLAIGCGTATAPLVDAAARTDAGIDAFVLDPAPDAGVDAFVSSDAGNDAGNDAVVPDDVGVDAGPSCPCFDEAILASIEALSGSRVCVVDEAGGGTMQTALIRVLTEERVAAEAPVAGDGELLCGYGCLSFEMGGGCGAAPAFMQHRDLDVQSWTACHDLIAAHCE